MSKTQFSLSVSNGTNSASVSTDDVSDIVRLMQLSGQQGNNFSLNVNQTQSEQGADHTVSQSSNLSLSTKNPSDIMQALRNMIVSQDAPSQTTKACGCPQDCDCDCEGPACDAPGVEMYEGIDKDYPDTAEGAIQALGDMSTHNVQGATATPDPQVDRVWLVKHSGGQSIVYLKKPGDNHSHDQPMNDFEDIDEGFDTVGMQVEEEAEFDWGARDWKHDQHVVSMKRATKQGTAQEPERLTSPSFGSNPLTQEIHERIMNSWAQYLGEDEKFDNEDGTSSPLSADKRQDFDKDPMASEQPDISGDSSPMSNIVRQSIPR